MYRATEYLEDSTFAGIKVGRSSYPSGQQGSYSISPLEWRNISQIYQQKIFPEELGYPVDGEDSGATTNQTAFAHINSL